MQKSTVSAIALALIIVTALSATGSASISVGVKKADWIEYQVTVTGTPPQDHNIVWARMDVTDVQSKAISIDIQTKFSNGTILPEKITLNLASGVLGDDFIIPANLDIGDVFHDVYQGDISITSVEQRTAAGAERTVVSGATPQTSYYWDKSTGVLVDANSSFPDYTMITKVTGTNMWQPQTFTLDPTLFYTFITTILVIAVVAAIVLVLKRKRAT